MKWMILPFQRYFDFQGRSRRMEFWMFQLLNLIVGLVLAGPFYAAIVSASASGAAMGPDGEEAAIMEAFNSGMSPVTMVMLGLYGIYALAAIIPSIAVTIRRLHDRNMSGWWYLGMILASLIPIVGLLAALAFLVLMFLPGTPGPNRFGEDPKDPAQASVFE